MPKTIFENYNECKHELQKASIEDYVFESKQIIKYVTGYTSAQILSNYQSELSEFQQNMFTAIVKQRISHYPLQYIFGSWDFYGRKFFVGPGVLIPRSDTEILVDTALEFLKDKKSPFVLDLCAGSGCIGITLSLEKTDAKVTLLEKYETALNFINKNIQSLSAKNVTALCGDVFKSAAADKKYDLIVSNPPYIKQKDMAALQKEVTFEPDTALCGGEDGLDFYRTIAKNYANSLLPDGKLMFEVGFDEAKAVSEILSANGYFDIGVKSDLGGNERVVFGTAKGL